VDDEILVPGQPDDSPLIDVVIPEDNGAKPRMPKGGTPLTDAQVDSLRRWIAAGAPWPDGLAIEARKKADRTWWSLQPLSKAEPPSESSLRAVTSRPFPEAWADSPIDRFVLASLDRAGLTPSPPADPATLLRRVTYDLTGLPPTPDEVRAFLADPSPTAYESVVDRLLASPAYGEHWGRHWLDVVRFGESTGFEQNHAINNAWPFRDYVIRSFNDDKPFDQLTREHLAGDVLAPNDPNVAVGTTFLVCGPYDGVQNLDPAQAAQIRADTLDDPIRTTGEAFLGLTIGCARCHDHKFDPIAQADYYRLAAAFSGIHHGARTIATPSQRQETDDRRRPLIAERDRLKADLDALQKQAKDHPDAADPRALANLTASLHDAEAKLAANPPLPAWWVGQFSQPDEPTFVLTGGDPKKKAAQVAPASLSILADVATPYELPADAPESQRRLALANWLVAPENPLTPRVLANRIWQNHFGRGLVDTPSDFGQMGTAPSHPELLDWLARQLQADAWHLKPLHRRIVLSQTYRQASTYRDDAARIDGLDRLLWRFPPRRLAAEEVRDSILAIAGKLQTEPRGGPGFRLYEYLQDNVATYVPLDHPGPETYRRAVYHQNARASRVDLLAEFDCPDNAFSTPSRSSTTSPLQALTLMNHPFTLDMAAALADRLEHDAATTDARIDRAYLLAYARDPSSEEQHAAADFIAHHGLRAFARALLNSNELLFVR
jgi:hypothetical protein